MPKDEVRNAVENVAQALSFAASQDLDELTGRRAIKSVLTQVGKLNERYPKTLVMLAMWNVLSALAEEWAEGIPDDITPPRIAFQEIGTSEGIPAEWVQAALNKFMGRRAYVQAFEDGSTTVLCVSEMKLTQSRAWVEWEKYLTFKEEDEE